VPYYPIFIDLKKQKVLIVGGGKVAQRKIENILEYGAEIYVVAKEVNGPIQRYIIEAKIRHLGQEFDPSHLDDMFIR